MWFASRIHLFGSVSTGFRLGWKDNREVNRSVEERIGEALKLQQDGDNRLFGEIAIEQGFINDKAIRAYLDAKK